MPRSRIVIIGIALLIVFFGIAVYFGFGRQQTKSERIALTVWGVYDNADVIESLAASLPNYSIAYREFDPRTYESEVINALAAGTGPDIFMFHSSWLPKHADKIVPVAVADLSMRSLRDYFPTVVEQDFGPDQKNVYALPLYLDTLMLLYNRDTFDAESVALPPKTWSEFLKIIPKLRKLDTTGKIIKAAAAIGGSGIDINRASDLLSAIMLQVGTPMVSNDFTRATFSSSGLQPLLFYTQFSNPASESYTWTDAFGNSLERFADSSVAIIFNYAYQIPLLQKRNPFLSIGVAPLPQPEESKVPVNVASYWGLAVATQAANPLGAWGFIVELTTNEELMNRYAEETGRLPALKTLIAARQNDPAWDIQASQALSARSWPQIDNVEVDHIFSAMIRDVITGRVTPERALKEAERAVTALMEQRNRGF